MTTPTFLTADQIASALAPSLKQRGFRKRRLTLVQRPRRFDRLVPHSAFAVEPRCLVLCLWHCRERICKAAGHQL